MHIAYITPEFPHSKVKYSAGIGSSIKNLTLALVKSGVKITVFVYGQNESTVIKENGMEIHLIGDKNYIFGKWYFYRKYLQNYINDIIEKCNIDLIEAPDWTGITAFIKFRVPLVIRFHGSDTYFCHIEKRKQKFKNFLLEKLAVRNAQGYIAPTDYAGKISAKLFGIPFKKVITIHYGLQLENFQNNSPSQFHKDTILYLGTIIRKKGVFELPHILHLVRAKNPHAKLILIGADSVDIATGHSSTWELVSLLIKPEDKNHMSYLGKIPYQEVRKYIEQAHVCVFPTYAETLGMVTIESMAMQKSVVNSNIGWAKELIVDEESGFLVYPSDHQEYAKKITSILGNPQLTEKIGLGARKRVEEKFDISKKVVENCEFYQSLLNRK